MWSWQLFVDDDNYYNDDDPHPIISSSLPQKQSIEMVTRSDLSEFAFLYNQQSEVLYFIFIFWWECIMHAYIKIICIKKLFMHTFLLKYFTSYSRELYDQLRKMWVMRERIKLFSFSFLWSWSYHHHISNK